MKLFVLLLLTYAAGFIRGGRFTMAAMQEEQGRARRDPSSVLRSTAGARGEPEATTEDPASRDSAFPAEADIQTASAGREP